MKTKRGGQTTVANRDTASGHTVGGEDGVRGGVPWFCLVDVCKIRQGDVCKRLARGGWFQPNPFRQVAEETVGLSHCCIVACRIKVLPTSADRLDGAFEFPGLGQTPR